MMISHSAAAVPTTILHSRPFGIGDDQLILTSNDPRALARLEYLFAELPDARDNARRTWTIQLERVAAGPDSDARWTYQSSSPFDEATLASPDLDRHEDAITRLVNRLKIYTEADLVHLHCGAVGRGDRALLLAGESGAGKSTITAGLVRAGWGYITDDQVAVRLPEGELIPHRRPISLRRTIWHEFTGVNGVPDPATDDRKRVQIPSREFGGAQLTDRVIAALVVRVQRIGLGETGLHVATSQANAVCDVLGQSFDVARKGVERLDALIRLLTRRPIYDLAYGDLQGAHDLILRTFEDPVDEAISSPLYEVPRSVDQPDPGHIVRGTDVHSWRFNDGTTLLLRPSRWYLTTLSANERALWELLATPLQLDEVFRSVPCGEAQRPLQRWIGVLKSGGFLIGSGE